MDKFLDTPVTSESNMLISCSDVIAIQTGDASGADDATKTTIFYNSGNTVTLTHGSVSTALEMRDSLQNAMEEALKTSWTEVAFAYVPAKAVSAVAVA
tara:strand:+ start:498 stop:791 length:294 start_codon:yes stop_codon:yes gene_type:complete